MGAVSRFAALRWVLALFSVCAGRGFAEQPNLQFKDNPTRLEVSSGQAFSFDLKSFLSRSGTGGKLNWQTFGNPPIPTWAQVDSLNDRLTGNPPPTASGVFAFNVVVNEQGQGDAGTTGRIEITVRTAPVWNVAEVNLGDIPEGTNLSFNANQPQFVTDPGGGTLTFSVRDPNARRPAWLQVSNGGVFSGLPSRADVGTFDGFFLVARTQSGGTAELPVRGRVLKVFKGPKWTANPIQLPDATEDNAYRQNVSGTAFVAYNEPEALTFTIVNGSNRDWLQMSARGEITGTPLRPNGGQVTLIARVSVTYEGVVYEDQTTLRFNVKLINKPPVWSADPVVLPDAFTRVVYPGQNLNAFVSDPDAGTQLTFRIVGRTGPGAEWVNLTQGGIFSGTPQNANLGQNEWLVEVSDGEFPVTARVRVAVKNRAPRWKANPVVLTPNAVEDSAYTAQLAPFAEDPEGDPLTFTKVGGPAWAQINAQGRFTGTPRRPDDLGLQVFRVRVADALSGGSDETEVHVVVDKINKPPQWSAEEITLPNAPERSPYSQSLAAFVSDPDEGDALEFTKVSGPAWASISRAGQVTGTPQRPDLGRFAYLVQVRDAGGLTARATVFITVTKVNRPPLCENPAQLADAVEGLPYTFNLSALATDPDADLITFTAVDKPAWMAANAQGALSGTPAEADIGTYEAEFEVTDPDGASCRLLAQGRVLRGNWRPEIKEPIEFTVRERQIFTVDLNDPQYVVDQDPNDVLEFELLDNAPWVALSGAGALTLRPEFIHISPPVHRFRFSVTDGKATTQGSFSVTVLRDPRPPQWLESPIRFTTNAGQPFNATLADKVLDLDGLAVSFAAVSAPSWLSVATNGALSGTPQESDVGENFAVVRVSNDALGANVDVIIRVLSTNRPPRWTRNPVVLPNAVVGENYAETLSAFVTDPDANDRLRFEQRTTSPWVFVTNSGLVIGTPQARDLGLNRITVRVLDQHGAFADAEVQIRVVEPNQPPRWTQDPINLGRATVAQVFNFDLRRFVIEPEGDSLTFRKAVQAPAWLQVSQAGIVSGTPQPGDLGPYTTLFEVSDNGQRWVPVNAFGEVVREPKPPQLNLGALVFTVEAGQVLQENLNQARFVVDPEGEALTFQLLQGASWVSLSSAGALELRPLDPQIGQHQFPLRVTNVSGATAEGPIRVTVTKPPAPIKWLEDPIRFTATVNRPFSASLVGKVSNPDNLALIFSKGSGDAWMAVGQNGSLSGTPTEVREFFFSVSVTANGRPPATATVIVKVNPEEPDEDSIAIDEPVPGARVDNVWVVDHAHDPCAGSHCIVRDLRNAIGIYYQELDRARIHHYGVYLSSDACNYRSPIRDSRGELLLRYDDRSWVTSFNSRIDRSSGQRQWNSPLVALWQLLYTSLPQVPGPFYEKKVPLETLMVSAFADQYRNYYHWNPIRNWTPTQFSNFYKDQLERADKPLRVSVVAPHRTEYRNPVDATRGKYYVYSSSTSMRSAITDYAKEVIFRAYVTAKTQIPLSRTPNDPSSIEVLLAGRPLDARLWRYNAAANAIEIDWDGVDLSTLRPGDRITIRYR